jgi:UDP-N-acetyl-D-mannosaminuronic acid dehydrogenase
VVNHKELELSEPPEAMHKADIIVFLVAHKQFRSFNVSNSKIVLDFCGALE